MKLKEQLEFCRQCDKRAFSDAGIICAITNQKPLFQDNCKDFSIDPKEAKRIALKTQNSESSHTISLYIGIGLILIRIIIWLIRN